MEILGFNRVELIVREDQIHDAIAQFNELLGLDLPQPHAIAGHPVLSATDSLGHIEFVAPIDGGGGFGAKLAAHGAGQIGPLVWEVDDIDAARAWLSERGFDIYFEYDSRTGNAEEQARGVRQLVLDPEQWFGFSVTFMQDLKRQR
jgi:hypothetical protein